MLTRTEPGEAGKVQKLVLPDNGLISCCWIGINCSVPILDESSILEKRLQPYISWTRHHGARHRSLGCGAARSDFGPECLAPKKLPDSSPEFRGNSVTGRAIHMDHYGNVISNIPADRLSIEPLAIVKLNWTRIWHWSYLSFRPMGNVRAVSSFCWLVRMGISKWPAWVAMRLSFSACEDEPDCVLTVD